MAAVAVGAAGGVAAVQAAAVAGDHAAPGPARGVADVERIEVGEAVVAVLGAGGSRGGNRPGPGGGGAGPEERRAGPGGGAGGGAGADGARHGFSFGFRGSGGGRSVAAPGAPGAD